MKKQVSLVRTYFSTLCKDGTLGIKHADKDGAEIILKPKTKVHVPDNRLAKLSGHGFVSTGLVSKVSDAVGSQAIRSCINQKNLAMYNKQFNFLILFLAAFAKVSTAQQMPFQNVNLPFEKRVDDLMSRMTLEEKVSQMVDQSKAIPRLQIPEYNWWNECLHGVGRAGLATVFPEPIGSAASFDADLISRIAVATSDEARAKHHEALRDNQHGRYQGLTYWSPNINIFRDPRWGRGMETYGEDPYLTSVMGDQFIRGLQGNDPKYLKLVATAKHYMVHSGPEIGRHQFNSTTDTYDFLDTYLPAFKSAVKTGGSYSIMSAYNSYNGVAAPANVFLLSKVLRQELGFNGYVVSDCDAVKDIYTGHKEARSKEEAAAMAVNAGNDLNCGDTYLTLVGAVKAGLISEEKVNLSLRRLLLARFKLGMFDDEKFVKYAAIPYSTVNSASHQRLALEAARESIVLLKNQNGLLPLKKNLTTVAVIGANADDKEALWGNYNGTPGFTVTPLEGIRKKLPGANVIYARGCELVEQSGSDTVAAQKNFREALAAAEKAETVILFMGLSPRLEGEELPIKIKGFAGGDRETIALPPIQQRLIKAIYQTGKPVILVLLNGSAVAINWEKENLSAIIESWYGGQAAGTAIADVLFGDYNPAGRLPVTFYKSENDLPHFHDYSMKGRTYRYFTGEVLYPFGYGLSYTRFRYSQPTVPGSILTGKSVRVSARVTNTGKVAGDEVVQLYVRHLADGVRKPLIALKGFKRIHLKAGETKVVPFMLKPDDLALVSTGDRLVERAGAVNIFIAGQLPLVATHPSGVNLVVQRSMIKGDDFVLD
ncbi:glycoside hydrolase family 3 C-terminal domain-containing protein [Mucilaginibacter sp. PAMB04168]|uniref:glycoside hydrolase family 3 C-terminal domain-containing protein n=1 Tax=Mucilaginibacter sp. PAMB04168 TaxID=3138567 RepID=UPI0031F6A738